MSHDATRIATDVDYERDGKQVSYLRVPHSRDDSAWGSLMVPIVCLRNGDGPTVLFTGANHGDEYEGPVSLLKLGRELDAGAIRGRVIVMPALNLPALLAGQRLSPVDGKNMNRVFPGERDGTMTSVIAHYVTTELLPRADVVVDIHSGGKSLIFMPAVIVHKLDDRVRMDETLAALKAFGAPLGLVLRELDDTGMLDTTVEKSDKVFLSTELGGGGMLSPATVEIADTGVRNLLKHFGVIGGDVVTPADAGRAPTRLMDTPDVTSFVVAPEDGLYEPAVEVGQPVRAGDALGWIHFVTVPDREPVTIAARRSGLLICRRGQGHAQHGDTLAVVAADFAPD
jgi:N-alpha-acetyl-L-2,4-diaminobutyrate deacetylase